MGRRGVWSVTVSQLWQDLVSSGRRQGGGGFKDNPELFCETGTVRADAGQAGVAEGQRVKQNKSSSSL